MKLLKLSVISAFIMIISCSSSIFINYSHPEIEDVSPYSSTYKIVLASTNSLNSNFKETISTFSVDDNKSPMLIKSGGLDKLKHYFDILRSSFKNQTIIIDSGNIFKKNSSGQNLSSILKSYHKIGYDAVSFGTRELTLLPKIINSKAKSIFFLSSNIQNLKRKNLDDIRILSYRVLNRKGIRVGIASVTLNNKIKELQKYFIEDAVLSILKTRKKISKRIDLFVLIVDSKTNCKSKNTDSSFALDDYKNQSLDCPNNDPLVQFLKRLPPNAVDILYNNTQAFIGGFIGEVPIISNPGLGQFFNTVSISFDKNRKIIKNKSVVNTPTKICTNFFKEKKSCFINLKELELSIYHSSSNKSTAAIPTSSNYKLSPAVFLGKIVK